MGTAKPLGQMKELLNPSRKDDKITHLPDLKDVVGMTTIDGG